MTKTERYTLHQNGNYHTVIDEEENIPMIIIEFKENEFPVYACFHRIIDLLNEQEEIIQEYKHLVKIATSIIEWNTIPQIRREWQKHLSKVGDVE